MAAKPLAQLSEEVLRILADRGYADYTVKRYGEHFRAFPRWTDEEGRGARSARLVRDYLLARFSADVEG